MNTDVIKGKWKQLSGTMKEKWGKLTDDDVQAADGHAEYPVSYTHLTLPTIYSV